MEKVNITELFTINGSANVDKIRLTEGELNDVDALPYVTRTEKNNGVSGYCFPMKGKVNPGGVITMALDGSTGSTFYQHHEYLSGQNIWVLKPTNKVGELTPEIALYLVASIRKAVKAYTYNLSLTKTRLKNINIYVPMTPEGNLDRDSIQKRMESIRNINLIKNIPENRYQILD